MSNSKNYNSILFLTTLSVYLGLVLVGASPQVLAQQITFVNKFEIQNEIEFEDDLDKKPEDNESSEIKKFAHNLSFEKSGETDLVVKNNKFLSSLFEKSFQINCINKNCSNFQIQAESDKLPTAFDFIKKNNAKDFFDLSSELQNPALKILTNLSVYERNISTENKQVFAAPTSLPRGSLDVLL